MDRSIAYAQVYSNFGSAYNALPQALYTPPNQTAVYPSFLFNGNRPVSPLFRRSTSPTPAPMMIPTGRTPKFNFDLYRMDGSNDDTFLPPPRPISPPSSLVIHHRPIYTTLDPTETTREPAALTKLRDINDELYHTLARSDPLDSVVQPAAKPSGAHYHIHHYPVSQHPPHQTYRTRSPPEYLSPTVTREPSPKVNKARVTYKIHIPRRYRPENSHRKSSPSRRIHDHEEIYISEESSGNDSIVVDMYPTRDQAVQTRQDKREPHSDPWVVSGRAIRRNSYSDENTDRSAKGHHGYSYGDKPIQSHRPSTHRKDRHPSGVRHRSPFVASHYRPDSAPAYESDPYRDPAPHFVHDEASSRPRRATREKPRTQPSSHRQLAEPHDGKHRNKHILAFDSQEEATPRPTYETRRERHSPPATESGSETYRRTNIRRDDRKFKERIAQAESKVKTAWKPTVNGSTSKSIVSEPATPSRERTPSMVEPPASTSNVQTSFSDISKQPATETTPKDQSRTSEPKRVVKTATPPPPPSHETTIEEPEKPVVPPINDPAPSPVPTEPETDRSRPVTPSPPPSPPPEEEPEPGAKTPSPVPSEQNNESAREKESKGESEGDEADQEVALSMKFKDWFNKAKEEIDPSATNGGAAPPPPATIRPAEPPKVTQKTTPGRKPQPPSPAPSSPDRDLYKPPFGPKKNQPEKKDDPPPPPPITTSAEDGNATQSEVDDFFD